MGDWIGITLWQQQASRDRKKGFEITSGSKIQSSVDWDILGLVASASELTLSPDSMVMEICVTMISSKNGEKTCTSAPFYYVIRRD